jgi:hypothetical protein
MAGRLASRSCRLTISEVRRAASEMRLSLNEDYRLLVAVGKGELIGWLVLRMNSTPLTRHWAP